MSIPFDNLKWAAEKLGIPVVFSAVLCFAIYSTGRWTAEKIFEPLVTKHIQFLETEQQTMRNIAGEVGKQTTLTDRQTRLLEEIRNDQRKFPAVAEAKP